MRLLLLSFIIAVVQASPLLSDKACAWGPSYWCSHVKHAQECGAFQHCLSTVWKNQILQEKSTDTTCTYCQLIVSAMKDALENHQTQEEIAKVAAEMCSILPNPDWQDQCAGIVKQYTPQLIQMLENDISTDMICATLDLCPGLEDTYSPYGKEKVKVTETQVQLSTECDDCTKFFQDVQNSITSNETLAQLEQLINQTLCMELGSLSNLCNQAVQEYLPLGLQFIADQIDPNIVCRVFGFCTTEGSIAPVIPLKSLFKDRTQKTPLQYRSSEECDICKDLMVQIDNELRDRTVQEKTIELIENNICEAMGSFSAQCKQLVEEYSPMLFELLVNELDPTTFCQTIGVCTTPSLDKVIMKTVIMPVVKERPEQGWGYVAESEGCTFCKFFFTEIDNLLKDNATVATVEDLLDKVCAKLTTDQLTKQCDAFVTMYGYKVIALLAEALDATELCTKVGVCAGVVSKEEEKVVTDAKCQFCILVVQEVETLLQNVSSDEIMGFLNMVCGYLPVNYSSMCVTYVKEYAPIVIELLKSKEDPKSLCMMGKLCSAQVSSTPYMTVPIPEDLPVKTGVSVTCEVCDTALLVLKEIVGQNATEAEIEAKLEELCNYVPSGYKSECDALVQQYGPMIISYLVNDLDPHTICINLGLCSSSLLASPALQGILSPVDMLPLLPGNSQKEKVGVTIQCEVCDTALVVLKELIGQNATQAEIEAKLEELCNYVPSGYKSTCDSLVEQYGPAIVQYLVNDLDPHTICINLGLCSSSLLASPALQGILSPVDMLPMSPGNSQKDAVGEAFECKECKMVLNYIVDKVGENKTEEKIKELLDRVCEDLPDTISGECKTLVDEYEKMIINLILLNVSPEEICKKISLCTTSSVKSLPVHVKLLKDKTVSKNTVASPTECVICEFVLKELDNLLKGNKSEAVIDGALKKVCSLFPSTISAECDSFVQQYGPLIVNLLVSEIDPKDVCTKLGLCTAELDGMIADVHMTADQPPVSEPVICTVCKAVMKEVDQLLAGNKSKEVIFNALDRVCGLMPDTISEECAQFVTQYAPMILNLLIQDIQPNEVCAELAFCPAQKISDTTAYPKKAVSKECSGCNMILIKLQRVVGTDAQQVEVFNGLRKVCRELPEESQSRCWDLVQTYGQKMVMLYKQGIDPFTSCSNIGVCEPNQGSDPLPPSVIAKEDAAVRCLFCESVVKLVKKYLKQNGTEAEIEHELKDLCDVLPDTVTAQCEELITTDIPIIIAKLEKQLNESEICKELNMCDEESLVTVRKHGQHTSDGSEDSTSKTNQENIPSKQSDDKLYFERHQAKPLLGSNECTYGPAFWCVNEENARKCNAMDHCRQHVWN